MTLDNRSGATYEDAKLKLIAGDVNTVPQPQPMEDAMVKMAMAAPSRKSQNGVSPNTICTRSAVR